MIFFIFFSLTVINASNTTLDDKSLPCSDNNVITKQSSQIPDDNIQASAATKSSLAKSVNKSEVKADSIVYVNSKGLSSSDGSVRSNPTSLESAINRFSEGQTLLLVTDSSNSDTYSISSPLYIRNKNNILITGETGKSITLNGQFKQQIFNIDTSRVVLTNLNIVGANASYGAIYAIDSYLAVKNCTFDANSGTYAGCIFSRSSNVELNTSVFKNSYSSYNGGVITQLDEKTLNINSCIFLGNVAKYDGGCVYSVESQVNVKSSQFIDNRARIAGALYLGDNRYRCSFSVTGSLFFNNYAESYASAIWTNYNNTFQHNAFITNYTKNMVYLDKCPRYNINLNWWGTNAPDFNTLTGGIVPDNWRLLKITSTNKNTYYLLTVSLNSLSDSTTTATNLFRRTATFTASNGSFTRNTMDITSMVNNNYMGSAVSTVQVRVDNQLVRVGSGTEAFLMLNNITTTKDRKVVFSIVANKAINRAVQLTIHNTSVSCTLKDGRASYTFSIPASWDYNNYTTKVVLSGDGNYNTKTVTGYLHVKNPDITIQPVSKTQIVLYNGQLPAKYDLREKGYVTSVKTQGSSGSCWAFSSLASLESALLNKTHVAYDFSENNMKNVMKKYSVIGQSDEDGRPNSGNNDFDPIGNLVSWYGPVLEEDDAYVASSIISPVMNASLKIQDVFIIPERKSATDNDLIKRTIMSYGAVSSGIYMTGSTNQYSTGHQITHSITIVGWDDTYSRNNFATKPPGDGAFIIKNSWGTSSGDKGYFYVSYYDDTIGSLNVGSKLINSSFADTLRYLDTLQPDSKEYNDTMDLLTNEQLNYVVLYENIDNYDNIYQYETVAYSLETFCDVYAIKNTYVAADDETIAAVGSYFMQKTKYDLEIYVNNNLVSTQSGTISTPGYRTIQLNEYVQLQKNDNFTVLININYTGDGHNYVLVEYTDVYYSPLGPKTSYLSMDGSKEWSDLYEYECAAPIKVYTKKTSDINSTVTKNNQQVIVKTTITNTKGGTLRYYIDDKLVATKTVNKNETITTPLDASLFTSSNYQLLARYSEENYRITEKISVEKNPTTVSINKIADTRYSNKYTITGTLTSNNKKIDGNLTITVNGQTFNTQTKNGQYTLALQANKTGTNNITVTYPGNSIYQKASSTTTFKVIKQTTTITINPVKSIVGEYFTLTAYIKDSNGNSVTGGNFVFKINGVSLKVNGKFENNNSLAPLKLSVNNGQVSYRMLADKYIRDAKNLTGSYSGATNYEQSTTNKATEAQIQLRYAQLRVTAPISTKQGTYITFTAKISDITPNAKNTGYINDNATVMFKVNGVTLKDSKGNPIKVKVVNNTATYNYYIAPGTGGITSDGKIRYYNVTAIYSSSNYYPSDSARGNTNYTVQRSAVTINISSVIIKKGPQTMSVSARIYDYLGKAVVGTNKICVKINGVSLKDSKNRPIYFNVKNGVINLKDIPIPKVTQYKLITIVTGERQAYLAGSGKTTKITIY